MLGEALGEDDIMGITVKVKGLRLENAGIPSEFRPNPLFL